jgi:predicted hotdog family 3-hydroxylacyl-ACP dehydratase
MPANKKCLFESIHDLVSHRPPMLLLTEVLDWNETSLTAVADTKSAMLFADAEGRIPAWVGIEYMAQAIAAFAGIVAKLESRPSRLGFLLGTRLYKSAVTHFSCNQPLHIYVKQELRDDIDNLVLFNCEIVVDGVSVAKAQIKAIQPENKEMILAQLDHAENNTNNE